MPGYTTWFNDTFVKEWVEKNNPKVIVDNIGLGEVLQHAAEESRAQ